MKLPRMDFEVVQFSLREEVAEELDAFIDYAQALGEVANTDNVVAMIVERFMARKVSAPFRNWKASPRADADATGEMRLPEPKPKKKPGDDTTSDVAVKTRRALTR